MEQEEKWEEGPERKEREHEHGGKGAHVPGATNMCLLLETNKMQFNKVLYLEGGKISV